MEITAVSSSQQIYLVTQAYCLVSEALPIGCPWFSSAATWDPLSPRFSTLVMKLTPHSAPVFPIPVYSLVFDPSPPPLVLIPTGPGVICVNLSVCYVSQHLGHILGLQLLLQFQQLFLDNSQQIVHIVL